MALSIKDPVTGQYNWPLIIGGGGIVVVGGLLLLNRGSGSTGTQVSSPGQSSDITGALGSLQQAIAGLNPGGGGNGGTTPPPTQGTAPLLYPGGKSEEGITFDTLNIFAQRGSWGQYNTLYQYMLKMGSIMPEQYTQLYKQHQGDTTVIQNVNTQFQSPITNPNQPGATTPTPGPAALNQVITPSASSKVSNVSESVGTTPRQNPTSPVGGNYTGRIQNAPKLIGPTGPPYRTA